MLNFPPKLGVKLTDIDNFAENNGELKIEFWSEKQLNFPEKNFLKTVKKNPIWLSPFKPDLFYNKYSQENKKKVWVFRNKTHGFHEMVI